MRILQSRQFLDWQQFCSKAWRPPGQFATHHLFLGHCCTHRPAAQLMPEKKPPHPLLHLKIDRKSCCGRFHRGNYAFFQQMRIPPPPLDSSASNSASPSFLPCFPRCQLVQPRQLPATDLFCRLGRLLVVLVTPFCLLTAPHCSTSSLRSGSTIATTTGSFRCRCRCRHHVKSPRVSRNCCLLRPFAKAAALDPHRWSSTGRRSGGGGPAQLQLQHPITTLSSD